MSLSRAVIIRGPCCGGRLKQVLAPPPQSLRHHRTRVSTHRRDIRGLGTNRQGGGVLGAAHLHAGDPGAGPGANALPQLDLGHRHPPMAGQQSRIPPRAQSSANETTAEPTAGTHEGLRIAVEDGLRSGMAPKAGAVQVVTCAWTLSWDARTSQYLAASSRLALPSTTTLFLGSRTGHGTRFEAPRGDKIPDQAAFLSRATFAMTMPISSKWRRPTGTPHFCSVKI